MAPWTDLPPPAGGDDAELAGRLGLQSKIDVNVPSVARVYDAILGGKDNFAVDRAVADQLLTVVPGARASAQAHRAFLGRADLKSGKFRPIEQIEGYFSGLELVPPGVVFDPLWHPDEPVPAEMDEVFKVGVVGVARVPG